jgi:hypothetical protein
MSKIIDFYRGEPLTSYFGCQYSLDEMIQKWSYDRLEAAHDYVQWMFPLTEESMFNPDAPILTQEDIQIFRSDPELKGKVIDCCQKFLWFLGLQFDMEDSKWIVKKGPNFAERREVWEEFNHNWLRVTRVIKSLRLLGLEEQAKAFFAMASTLIPRQSDSYRYWEDAANGPLHLPKA